MQSIQKSFAPPLSNLRPLAARLNAMLSVGRVWAHLRRLAGPLVAPPSAERFRLVSYFSFMACCLMAVVAVIVVSLFQRHQTDTLLRIAESQNVALARSFGNIIWLSHADYLGTVKDLDGDALRRRPETAELDLELRKITHGLPVMKVKIYNPEGLTVYSSEPSQIGESKSANAGFLKAAGSAKPVSKTSSRGEFSAFSGVVSDVELAETYVPLLDANGSVTTVLELYTDISRHADRMNASAWQAAALLLGAFLVIYLSLLLVVRRADGIIQLQHDALTVANAELLGARGLADELNQRLAEKVKALNRSNQDLQDFAHVAAHDLQEPLRKIEVLGGRLLTRHYEKLPDDGRMFVERMQDAAGRMRKLISDLLAFSRLARLQTEFAQVDLNDVVAGVLSDLHVRIEESGATVNVGILPEIEASAGQMRQLLQNLTANALKFHKHGVAPIVEISATKERDVSGEEIAVISVRDNGVGFDGLHKDKLFKLFERLHGKSEFEGTGIGLATCLRIVEHHHGSIDASSRPGEGAVFTFRVPVRQSAATSQAAPGLG